MKDAIILTLVALLFRFALLTFTGFDSLYGQDAFAYYNYSLDLQEALASWQKPPPFFWPLGSPILVAAATSLPGSSTPAAQFVSLIAGALIAPLVYFIVLEIRPQARLGALSASLLAAVGGQLVLSSLSIMADSAALAWATSSAYAMMLYLKRLQYRWLVLAAFALGAAIVTRWAYAVLVLPWGLAAILAWRAASYRPAQIVKAARLAILIGGSLLVLAGIGLQFGWDQPLFQKSLQSTQIGHLWRPALIGITIVSLLGTTAWAVKDLTEFAGWDRDRTNAAYWVEANVPDEAGVITLDLTSTLDHYAGLPVEDIYSLEPSELAAKVEENDPLYLLLNVENIKNQWPGKAPFLNYQWFKTHTNPVEIGRYPPFTLFRSGPPQVKTAS